MAVEIHDLTPDQVLMLEILWQMDSWDEVNSFKKKLTQERRDQADSLIELARLAQYDDVDLDVGSDITAMLDRLLAK